jgi:exonuclease SbcC
MRHIAKIHLQNFQSYKDQVIHLKPGLNLLIGTSDSGKSAILRAISFVLYNYPRNSTLIHQGESDTCVTLEFSDGTIVSRLKGSRNAYLAKTPDGKSLNFDKIDKAVPEEIKKILNFPPQDEFNGLISYADQFAPMFLVDLSPSDLPRSLSSLTGVELLEDCVKDLMQNYKSIEKQTKQSEKDLLKLIEELHQYDIVGSCEKNLEKLTESFNSFSNLTNQLEELKNYTFDVNFEEISRELDLLTKIIQNCDAVNNLIHKLQTKIDDFEKLNIFSLVSENDQEINVEFLIETIENCDLELSKIDSAEKQILSYENLKQINDQYLSVKEQGAMSSKAYKQIQEDMTEIEKDLENFKKQLFDKKILCEMCGSIL